MKSKIAAILFLTTLPLYGCLDLKQSISVTHDKIEYVREIRIDSKLVAISSANASKDPISCEGLSEKLTIPGVSIEMAESNDGTNMTCTLKLSTPYSTEGLNNLKAAVIKKEGGGSSPLSDADISDVKIEPIARGSYRFSQELHLKSDKDKGNDPFAEQMAQAIFMGRTISWVFVAPKILASNGKIAEDLKSVTWEVPVANAMKSPQTFTVDFQAPLPWYLKIWYAILNFFGI